MSHCPERHGHNECSRDCSGYTGESPHERIDALDGDLDETLELLHMTTEAIVGLTEQIKHLAKRVKALESSADPLARYSDQ